MQTSVDDSSIFTGVSRSSRFSLVFVGALAMMSSQGPKSWSGNFANSPRVFPIRKWVFEMASSNPSPPSSQSSFWPNHRRPRSLRYTVVATPQTRLVWSRKTTSPSEYNDSECKHLMGKRYASITNTWPKHRASALSGCLTSLSTSQKHLQ
jgi:hypothetical protein